MNEPTTDRPSIPGYGVPESNDGTLPWSWARERLEGALVYWLATTGPEGAPHLIPIWGAWVGDRWYVEGGPTRWQRNLRANSNLAIHVEFGDEVVIVEGTARQLVAPASPLSDAILGGYAKYRDTKGTRRAPRTGRTAACGSCAPLGRSPGPPSRRTQRASDSTPADGTRGGWWQRSRALVR